MMELVETHIRELLDAGPDAMVITDAQGTIVFANARIAAQFGYRHDELLGQPVEVLVPQRHRGRHTGFVGSYVQAPKTRPMGSNLDLHALRHDGSEFPVEVSLSPLMTEQGLLILCSIRDVTDRKQILQQLQAARQQAEQANLAKSAFLAAASHNLRQPLQTLTLLHSVLEKNITERTLATAVKVQGEALASVSALLNALLDISKLESGAIRPDIADCSVQAIFQRLKGTFEAQAQAKGLELQVDDREQIIRTDKGLFEQIVQNLLANAIRYTRKGMVRLRCIHDAAFARVEVMDTGIGIPINEQARIFEEFCQLKQEADRPGEGMGLGLAIVRRMAALLGHSVDVTSEPGKGSCFSITVPVGNKVAATAIDLTASQQANSATVPQVGRSLIMVIDDNPTVASATEMLLEMEGHRVLIAGNRQEALASMHNQHRWPDIIVCDYHLASGDSGLDVIGHLRDLAQQSIPAILVTGDTSSGVAIAAQRLGNCEVLSKPFVPDRFLELVNELLKIGAAATISRDETCTN